MQVPFRMEAVQAPVIPIVGEMIRNSPGTISLGQGVVYYGPPPQIQNGIEKFFADSQNHKYKLVQGIPSLLEAVARKLRRENRIELTAENALIITAGGNMAFMNAVLAITDPGDEIVIQSPFYFNHDMAINMAGCRAVSVPMTDQFQLDLDRIKAAVTTRTRAIVTVSPNNPTGAVYNRADLVELNRFCGEQGLYHISDEAYEYFTYDETVHFSPASLPGSEEHTISLFSLSKAFGFASWRIGYMTLPEALVVSVKKIQDTILICPPVISQYAAVEAIEAGQAYCESKMSPIRQSRGQLIAALEELGDAVYFPRTSGAFYFLIKLRSDLSDLEVIERLVAEFKVAVIPGRAFGTSDGCYLRVAYGALEAATAREAIDRLKRGLRSILANELSGRSTGEKLSRPVK